MICIVLVPCPPRISCICQLRQSLWGPRACGAHSRAVLGAMPNPQTARSQSRHVRVAERSGEPPRGVTVRDASQRRRVSFDTGAGAAGSSGDPAGSEDDSRAGGDVDWGNSGRLGVYCCNFGDVRRADFLEPLIQGLCSAPATIILGQEMTTKVAAALRASGWLVSDDAFSGDGRTSGGAGLIIAARSSVVAELRTLPKLSGSFGPAEERSYYLFANLVFKWGIAGFGEMAVGNFHVHRALGKRGAASPNWAAFVHQLAVSTRACGARVLGGDANMGLWCVGPTLREKGVEAVLACHHREISIRDPVQLGSTTAVRAAMRYDSLGIWLLGPRGPIRRLSIHSNCILGAMHPAFLEKTGERLVAYQRGYKLDSYALPRAGGELPVHRDDVPSEQTLRAVNLLWDMHGIQMLGKSSGEWRMGPDNTREWIPDDAIEGMDTLWLAAASALDLPGERKQAALQRLNLEITRDYDATRPRSNAPVGSDAVDFSPPGVWTNSWKPIRFAQEVAPDFTKFDPSGFVWGRPGHYPLILTMGSNRTHSEDGSRVRGTAKSKTAWWREEDGRTWPWWWFHESEQTFWLPGRQDQGRGQSGHMAIKDHCISILSSAEF